MSTVLMPLFKQTLSHTKHNRPARLIQTGIYLIQTMEGSSSLPEVVIVINITYSK